VNPSSLLKLLGYSRILMASLLRWPMYLVAIPSVEVPLKSIWWAVSIQCSATVYFSSCSRRMCLMCSLHLASMVLQVCLEQLEKSAVKRQFYTATWRSWLPVKTSLNSVVVKAIDHIEQWCLRTGCWGEYLDLRRRK
jgi:hypothetical protein